jgi:hypothetical protein
MNDEWNKRYSLFNEINNDSTDIKQLYHDFIDHMPVFPDEKAEPLTQKSFIANIWTFMFPT